MNAAVSSPRVDTGAAFGSVLESHLAREALIRGIPASALHLSRRSIMAKAERFNVFRIFRVTSRPISGSTSVNGHIAIYLMH